MSLIRDLITLLTSRRKTRNYDLTNLAVLIPYFEENLSPIGTIIPKITPTTPGDTWVRINGQALSKADYPQLYADIGGTFGETADTFNLPDLTDTYLIGAGASAGSIVGANQVTLTVDQIPAHNHTVTDPGHGHTATSPPHSHTVTDPGHTHTITDPGHTHTSGEVGATGTAGADSGVTAGNTGSSTTGITVDSATTGVTVDNATATVAVDSATTGVTIGDTGGGQAFDNRPRSIEVYYFIKARL